MDLFDLHCDTLTSCCNKGLSLAENELEISLQKGAYLERWAQCFAVFVPDELRGEAAYDYYRRAVDYYRAQAAPPLLREGAQLAALRRGERRLCPILTVEGGAVLAGRLERIQALAEDGVQMLTITWNGENELGWGISENRGLKPLGREAVREMERWGILPDVSHLSQWGFYDLAAVAEGPIVASHSNAKALCNHPRNLTDEQFAVIRDRGGLVGLNYNQGFLREDGPATPDDIAEHALHFLALGGEKTLALGSDFDGAEMPQQLPDIAALPTLADAMARRGIGPQQIQAIFFDNAADFFERRLSSF
ncbi:membrane dipeptidase [Bittarella massiliensis]|uniref:dipeptidase n=1 Tax=Bittarella massiliensis (ex Durand et al. 2017) TaxID=1720313 RepID=UPI00163CD56A|nr:membrane dipeptidase [Bittarella massiliensis (ex Durand et al. 2017)]MBC2870601.1 membrane dipeptidase [Bittarella massiliensis (ex Durand et al. 2017)]